MANKYELNENTDLASLAKQVEQIAAKRTDPSPETAGGIPVHEVVDEPVAHKPATRVVPTNRSMLFGIAAGAILVVAIVGTLFGRQLFKPGLRAVPDLAGEKTAPATVTLKDCGFKVDFEYDKTSRQTAGTVIATVPPAGQKIRCGERVVLMIAGKAPNQSRAVDTKPERPAPVKKDETPPIVTPKVEEPKKETVTEKPVPETPKEASKTLAVPTLEGMKAEDARKALQDAGLKVVEETAADLQHPDGVVLGVDPKAGTEVQPGSTVVLRINARPKDAPAAQDTPQPESRNPRKSAVPDVIGTASQDAVKTLRAHGLEPMWTYEASQRYTPGTVTQCTPPAGSRVDPGCRVMLVIAK